MDNHALLTVLVALIGVSVLIQVIIMVGAAIAIVALRKAITSAVETTTDLKATVVPMVHNTRQLIEQISPKVVSITNDVSELTQLLRKETVTVKDSLNGMIERVNKQTERLDTMLTTSLNAVDRAGSVIESAVSKPVRQANGIFAAVKAVVETYRKTDPQSAGSVRGYKAPSSSYYPQPAASQRVASVGTASGAVAASQVKVSSAQKDFEI